MEIIDDRLFYILRVAVVSLAHGFSLAMLSRSDGKSSNAVLWMVAITLTLTLGGVILVFLLPLKFLNVSATAMMMLFLLSAAFCAMNRTTPMTERLFIFIIYVSVFMLAVGFSNAISSILFPPEMVEHAQLIIRTSFSVILIILLKMFLRDRIYSLLDDLAYHGAEITLFSWLIGLSILSYVIFAAFFISNPVEKLVVLSIMVLMVISGLTVAIRLVRLTKREMEAERAAQRQRLLEDELEAEKAFVVKAKEMRHDQRHHDRVLLEYLEEGKIEEAKNYLGAHERTISDDSLMSWCGNPLFDAQLRIAWRHCKAHGIMFDVDVHLPSDGVVDDLDFVTVAGNLLENAIEAVEKCQTKYISVVSKLSNDRLLLEIRNTYSGEIVWVDGFPRSTKKGGGTGVKSVAEILSRLGGLLHQENDGNIFISRVIIPVGKL